MWTDFGAAQPPLRAWPVIKIQHYLAIAGAIDDHEEAQRAADSRQSTPHLPARPPDPQGLQRLRERAGPVPPPPQ